MRRAVVVLGVCGVVLSATSAWAAVSWQPLRSLPQPRMLAAGATASGASGVTHVYIVGGADASGGVHGGMWMYQANLNIWQQRATMPASLFGLAATGDGPKIYTVGGETSSHLASRAFYAYNAKKDSWATMPVRLPHARADLAAVSFRTKAGVIVYAIGGAATPTTGTGGVTSEVDEYQSATKLFQAGPSLPAPRAGAAAVTLGGKIYVLGGQSTIPGVPTATVYRFDPANPGAGWVTAASMPSRRSWFGAATVGGKIYTIGGGQTQVYDPTTDTWTAIGAQLTRTRLAVASIHGTIYAMGGSYHGVLTSVKRLAP
jgi:N-acetylneuraminic acid mutarotase